MDDVTLMSSEKTIFRQSTHHIFQASATRKRFPVGKVNPAQMAIAHNADDIIRMC